MIVRSRWIRLMTSVSVACIASTVPVVQSIASTGWTGNAKTLCVSGGELTPTAECQNNFEAAVARWPDARPALAGSISGNGKWLVLDSDGRHFDEVSIYVGLGQIPVTDPGSPARHAGGGSSVPDALAFSNSGSGQLNLSGWPCGSYPRWWGKVAVTTWYVTYLEMNVQGYLDHCNYAVTQYLTPYVTGAGNWTNDHGVIGNYSWNTNPWINWYGSNILLCCSVTVYQRYNINGNGQWSWWEQW